MPYYRIRDSRSGKLVVRQTEATSLGPALHPDDQEFANAIIGEVQKACEYFYKASYDPYPGCPEIEGISDDEVRERIQRLDEGENLREARRTNKKRYPLAAMPFERQRALIERIERLKHHYEFEKLSDEEGQELLRAQREEAAHSTSAANPYDYFFYT